jgi:putative transcriptional regulator
MKSLTGHLLVATPRLLDPNFSRTVLLMFQHSDEGAAGVVLNRPTEATITDVAGQIFSDPFTWEKPIRIGGPVPGPLIVLHQVEDLSDHPVIPGVFRTFDSTKIQELLREQTEPSLIIANYAGWGPGQLEAEIDEESWLDLPAKRDHIFWDEARDLWDTVVKEINTAKTAKLLGIAPIPDDPRAN